MKHETLPGEIQEVRINIPGIEHILAGKDALFFLKKDGANIILSGPAGSGKTLFAIQMAVTAYCNGMNIIYLTKDIPQDGVHHRINNIFSDFGKKNLEKKITPLNQDVNKEQELSFIKKDDRFFVIADLNLSTVPPLAFRSDIFQQPLIDSLNFLCPHMKNTFDKISKKYHQKQHNLMIFIDALSNELLLECLKKQAERPNGVHRNLQSRSINVFVSEFTALPDESFATYPPDLHFQFDLRDEGHGYSTKTIQVKKSRMQEVRHEVFPFVIVDAITASTVNRDTPIPLKKYIQCFWQTREDWNLKHRWMVQNIPFTPEVTIEQFLQLNRLKQFAERWQISTIFRNELPIDTQSEQLQDNDIVVLSKTPVSQLPPDKEVIQYQDICDFKSREPGISIMPSLADAALQNSLRQKGNAYYSPVGIRFGIPDIDRLTYEGMLDSKCCTLLVTENRCYSGIFGLHYLLGDIGYILQQIDETRKSSGSKTENQSITGYQGSTSQLAGTGKLEPDKQDNKPPCLWQTTPRSVLYIALDTDVRNIIHDILRFPILRAALWDNGLSEDEFESLLDQLEEIQRKANQSRHEVGILYSIPLRHVSCSLSPFKGGASYLYILVPALSWTTPEEILERLQQLLKRNCRHQNCPTNEEEFKSSNKFPCRSRCVGPNCENSSCIDFFPGECLTIDRVLLNRVGRIASRWPLIKDPFLFVSNLTQMCLNAGVDLMIVDDTADQSSTNGHLVSQWSNYARNIIRLKKVQFHGSETVLFDIVRAGARNLITYQPQELRLHTQPGVNINGKNTEYKLDLRDSFRGYTQLFSSAPQRCKVIVDLEYDQIDTPLYQDVCTIRRNLESLMGEQITVNLIGPEARIGVNSALANLSYVTQNTCHIVAIDEIWLHRIIGNQRQPSGLVSLSARDLLSAQPEYQFLLDPFIHTWDAHKNDPGHRRKIMRLLAGFHDRGSIKEIDDTIRELIYGRYVTEALSLACKKANRGKEILAIPYRHNWGVFTVAQPYLTRLRRLIGGFMKYSRTLVRDEDKWAWQIIDYLLDEETADNSFDNGATSEKTKEFPKNIFPIIPAVLAEKFTESKLKMIEQLRSAIWLSKDGDAVDFCWDDLIFFKRYVWNTVVPTIQKLIGDLSLTGIVTGDDQDNSTLLLLKKHLNDIEDLYFFDFDRSTEESIVCFFLELLLTHEDIDKIFIKADKSLTREAFNTACLLKFNVSSTPKEFENSTLFRDALGRTLIRLHQLLTRRQRYEIQKGLSPLLKQDTNNESVESPPVSYALFAREWLSTVPRLTNPFDLRERIKILHFPAGERDGGACLEKVTNFGATEQIPIDIQKSFKRLHWINNPDNNKTVGVSLSGMWYLGALSGGNEELAADVIREILSDYHERERLLTQCAAPVQHHFYKAVNSSMISSIPYAGIVARVYRKKRAQYKNLAKKVRMLYFKNQPLSKIQPSKKTHSPGGVLQPTFPFTRSRIIEYAYTSLLLGKLIRNAMKMEPNMMKDLYENWVCQPGSGNKPHKELQAIIDPIIAEIRRIYAEWDQRHADAGRDPD
ncbi:MAG TPA: hypothetical protein VHY08_11160 [Bacillota bacterium]|nr:hypothetical protein [Bacillota bacterium]